MIARRSTRLAAIALLVLVAACGATRAKTLRTTLAGVDATAAGFETWDGEHQLALVGQAETRDAAEAELVAYRARREVVVTAFEAAYRALAVAALDPDAGSIAPAVAAAQTVFQLVQQIRRGP